MKGRRRSAKRVRLDETSCGDRFLLLSPGTARPGEQRNAQPWPEWRPVMVAAICSTAAALYKEKETMRTDGGPSACRRGDRGGAGLYRRPTNATNRRGKGRRQLLFLGGGAGSWVRQHCTQDWAHALIAHAQQGGTGNSRGWIRAQLEGTASKTGRRGGAGRNGFVRRMGSWLASRRWRDVGVLHAKNTRARWPRGLRWADGEAIRKRK